MAFAIGVDTQNTSDLMDILIKKQVADQARESQETLAGLHLLDSIMGNTTMTSEAKYRAIQSMTESNAFPSKVGKITKGLLGNPNMFTPSEAERGQQVRAALPGMVSQALQQNPNLPRTPAGELTPQGQQTLAGAVMPQLGQVGGGPADLQGYLESTGHVAPKEIQQQRIASFMKLAENPESHDIALGLYPYALGVPADKNMYAAGMADLFTRVSKISPEARPGVVDMAVKGMLMRGLDPKEGTELHDLLTKQTSTEQAVTTLAEKQNAIIKGLSDAKTPEDFQRNMRNWNAINDLKFSLMDPHNYANLNRLKEVDAVDAELKRKEGIYFEKHGKYFEAMAAALPNRWDKIKADEIEGMHKSMTEMTTYAGILTKDTDQLQIQMEKLEADRATAVQKFMGDKKKIDHYNQDADQRMVILQGQVERNRTLLEKLNGPIFKSMIDISTKAGMSDTTKALQDAFIEYQKTFDLSGVRDTARTALAGHYAAGVSDAQIAAGIQNTPMPPDQKRVWLAVHQSMIQERAKTTGTTPNTQPTWGAQPPLKSLINALGPVNLGATQNLPQMGGGQ